MRWKLKIGLIGAAAGLLLPLCASATIYPKTTVLTDVGDGSFRLLITSTSTDDCTGPLTTTSTWVAYGVYGKLQNGNDIGNGEGIWTNYERASNSSTLSLFAGPHAKISSVAERCGAERVDEPQFLQYPPEKSLIRLFLPPVEMGNGTGTSIFNADATCLDIADTRIADAGDQDKNYGVGPQISTGQVGSGETWRSLIKFNMSSCAIPAGAIVNDASIVLNLNGINGSDVARTMFASQVLKNWTEGTDNGGTATDGASWNKYDGTNAWTTAGGDVTSSYSGWANLPTGMSADQDFILPLTATSVQNYLDGAPNYGYRLFLSSESVDQRDWKSREAASHQPVLLVNYNVPGTPNSFTETSQFNLDNTFHTTKIDLQSLLPGSSTGTTKDFCASLASTSTNIISQFGSDVGWGICTAGVFLFVPSSPSLENFSKLQTLTSTRFPFSYFAGMQETWAGLSASSTDNAPEMTMNLHDVGFGSSTRMGNILPNFTYMSTSTIGTYLSNTNLGTLKFLAGLSILLGLLFNIYVGIIFLTRKT